MCGENSTISATMEPEALAMVERFAPLYHSEAELRRANANANPPTVEARRQRDAVPLLATSADTSTDCLPSSRHNIHLAALSAMRNSWTVCTRYANSGILPIDMRGQGHRTC